MTTPKDEARMIERKAWEAGWNARQASLEAGMERRRCSEAVGSAGAYACVMGVMAALFTLAFAVAFARFGIWHGGLLLAGIGFGTLCAYGRRDYQRAKATLRALATKDKTNG